HARPRRRWRSLLTAHAAGSDGSGPFGGGDPDSVPAPCRPVERRQPELVEGPGGRPRDDLAHHDFQPPPRSPRGRRIADGWRRPASRPDGSRSITKHRVLFLATRDWY